MATQEVLLRHRIIIQMLRSNPAGFSEIEEKLRLESELNELNFDISLRTFQRDIKDILYVYGIEIKFDRTQKVYKIVNDDHDPYTERLFEGLDIFQVLKQKHAFSKYFQFDTRKPQGNEHLAGLLHAIQNRFQIRFYYRKFNAEHSERRIIEPYLLKEFRLRWYVFGYDIDRKSFRIFGLDRIDSLSISDIRFQNPQQIDPKRYFQNSFGIIGPDGKKPEKIILEFTNSQGNYVRTLPIHESQRILSDENGIMKIQLKLIPTYDFIIELLSFGEFVRVLAPDSLAEKVRNRLIQAANLYELSNEKKKN
ncbi:MAG: WYL domain-containing protein [Weeksellaceae bacterium]